jgi:hemolysin III
MQEYTLGEEIANAVTHGLGTLLSMTGLIILLILAVATGSVWHVVSYAIFGSTLVSLYLASTLYHGIPAPAAKRIFKIIDHSAIYLLIAGTYTPFLLTNLRGAWGWSLLGVIWGLAFTGIALKCTRFFRSDKASVIVYVGMGWLIVIAMREFTLHVQPTSILLLVVGGLSYTLGVLFYLWQKLPYHHAIWHLFVMGGSVSHYFSVYSLLPRSL